MCSQKKSPKSVPATMRERHSLTKIPSKFVPNPFPQGCRNGTAPEKSLQNKLTQLPPKSVPASLRERHHHKNIPSKISLLKFVPATATKKILSKISLLKYVPATMRERYRPQKISPQPKKNLRDEFTKF
jgi:hypothetical protein